MCRVFLASAVVVGLKRVDAEMGFEEGVWSQGAGEREGVVAGTVAAHRGDS